MRHRFLLIVILVAFFLAGCGQQTPNAPAESPTPTSQSSASEPLLFVLGEGLEISNSDATGDGEIFFEPGQRVNTLKITIRGEVPADLNAETGAVCWFCVDTIRISPGLYVPVDFFGSFVIDGSIPVSSGNMVNKYKMEEVDGVKRIKTPMEIETITYTDMVLVYPIPAESNQLVLAGNQGATLQKDGKKLVLTEGDALVYTLLP
jgi:hypothetical protein